HLRSVSNPAVWVAGDALVGPAQLSPLATYEGRLVGRNIVEGATHKPDYSVVPSGVFTVPALSSVGLTEAQADEQGLDVTVAVNDMSGWFSAKTYAESVAWVKTLVEKGTGRIVGAHIVGHNGEDLIHLFAMAMAHGITAAQIKDQFFAFPTFAADIKSML
ncbi:MAG: dihydrolipoyl dehydrogenase family protein, partial [Alphaproteobacteria bacterium]